ncbi:MAG: hypothetical protein RBT49_00870 [Bacteroidales bacterium]|jgi:hypothetical protein|nr:hypothetical protein [Bacteroidales bacterium]
MDKEEDIIKIAQTALRDNKLRKQNIPKIILEIIKENKWRERKLENLNTIEKFEYFPDFVCAPLPSGLDTDWEIIKKLISGYPDVELQVAKVITNPHGVHIKNNDGLNQPIIRKTKKQKDLQQLERHRPDLLEKVKKGELSVFGAMKEAGFRKPRMEVKLDPSKVVKIIKEKFTPKQIEEIIELLIRDDNTLHRK